jgi:hypothetical protein
MDAAVQHVDFGQCTIVNKGGTGGKGLYIHDGFYSSRIYDLHIASTGTNGDGLVCETASLVLFEMINVTDCGDTAWILGVASTGADNLGLGTGNNFINCQARKSQNGLEIRGGRANTFIGWWFEQNDGDFDLKIHENAVQYRFQGMMCISTELSEGAMLIGGDSGTSYRDACRGIVLDNFYFGFCGPTGVSGIIKTGACTDLTLERCAFKNNGGNAIMIDQTLGVTPTRVIDCDFDPVGATSTMPDGKRVVDENGTTRS